MVSRLTARSGPTVPMSRAATAFALALGAVGSAALAQSGPGGPGGPGGPDDSHWGLGLAVMNKQEAYTGMDRKTRVLPVLRYENDWLKIAGLGVELKLPGLALGDAGQLQFSLVGKGLLSGYKAKDSPFLAGMAERKGGFWMGARAEWENDWLDVGASWTADGSGKSKGQIVSLELQKTLRLGRQFMLMPHAEANWLDKKYVDYYYGVRAGEATAGRAAYTGKAGVNLGVGLRGVYMLDRQQSLMVDLRVTSLAKSIKNSSIVDRSNENGLLLGYTYRF